ncbi:hypothetical protein D3C76_1134010 [compost metagenome]
MIILRITTADIGMHTGVHHFIGVGRVLTVLVADRVQRKTRALLEGRDEVPAAFDEVWKFGGVRQQLTVIGPVHVTRKKRRRMGDADRGDGV